jgi:hypothetical protein
VKSMLRVATVIALLVPMAPFAQAAGVSDITGVLTSPTRNAIPGDKEEMDKRELCARRNLDNHGTVTGNCEPAKQLAHEACDGYYDKINHWACLHKRP